MFTRIELKFDSEKDARTVSQSVTPDNFPLPNGLEIKSSIIQNTIVFEIKCNRGLESLAATIEDLLGSIDLSIRTAESIN